MSHGLAIALVFFYCSYYISCDKGIVYGGISEQCSLKEQSPILFLRLDLMYFVKKGVFIY
jgi:hypothetical protein